MRHKCLAERSKPVQEQAGSVVCSRCSKWFLSRGGLAVHTRVEQSQQDMSDLLLLSFVNFHLNFSPNLWGAT